MILQQSRDGVDIDFEIPEDSDIYVVIEEVYRFLLACGYSSKTILNGMETIIEEYGNDG
jgi:hypothetical protein